jgi:hypothetical protein
MMNRRAVKAKCQGMNMKIVGTIIPVGSSSHQSDRKDNAEILLVLVMW